jgi:class 3 adenylate cyclase
MTAVAPCGVVTFLFTDVEGSTRRWETDAQAMRAALVVHDKVLRTAIEAYDGFLFKHSRDGVCGAFGSPVQMGHRQTDKPAKCRSHPTEGTRSWLRLL